MPMMIWIKEEFDPERIFDDKIMFTFTCDTNLVNTSRRFGGMNNRYHEGFSTSYINSIMARSNDEDAVKYGWHTYWIIEKNLISIPTQIWPEELRLTGLEEHPSLYENNAKGIELLDGAFEGNFTEISPDDLREMLFSKIPDDDDY